MEESVGYDNSDNSRKLCKPSTASRVCTASNSPNPPSSLCKFVKSPLLLSYEKETVTGKPAMTTVYSRTSKCHASFVSYSFKITVRDSIEEISVILGRLFNQSDNKTKGETATK